MSESPTPDNNASTDLVSVAQEGERWRRIGSWLALAEADDRTEKGRGAAAALRLYYAEQLDLPPMAANDLVMIKGRLFIQANVLRALAARRGYRVVKEECTYETCTAVLFGPEGDEIGRETYTL